MTECWTLDLVYKRRRRWAKECCASVVMRNKEQRKSVGQGEGCWRESLERVYVGTGDSGRQVVGNVVVVLVVVRASRQRGW